MLLSPGSGYQVNHLSVQAARGVRFQDKAFVYVRRSDSITKDNDCDKVRARIASRDFIFFFFAALAIPWSSVGLHRWSDENVQNATALLFSVLRNLLSPANSASIGLSVEDALANGVALVIGSYHDSRVGLVHIEGNPGLTRSLNLAASAAVGRLVAQVEHDDNAEVDLFAEQIQFLADHDMVDPHGTAVTAIDDAGRELGLIQEPETHHQITRHLAGANCLVHPAVMFRRALLDLHGYYDEQLRFAQDYDLWLRYSEQTKVHNLQVPLLKYRVHAGQINVGKVLQRSHKAVRAARRRRQDLDGKVDFLSRMLTNQRFEWRGWPVRLANFCPGQIDNVHTMSSRAVLRGLAWRASLNARPSPGAWRHLRHHYLQASPQLGHGAGAR